MMYKDDEYGFHCGNGACSRSCFACANRLTIIYGKWVKVPEVVE